MKTLNRKLNRVALALAAGVALAVAHSSMAQYASPVGTWDVVISGKANGVATLTFTEDYQLCGVEIITQASSGGGNDEPTGTRYVGSEPGRYPTQTSGTNNLNPGNVLYGYYQVQGWWSFDSAGKVIGSFPEIGTRTAVTTKDVVSTNDFGQVETNSVAVTEPIYLTNSVSFKVKVVPNKRLTMTGSSGIGKVNYRGVPFTGLTNVSYPLLAETKRGGQTFYETMRLQLGSLPGACVQSYQVCGVGPTYFFSGVALISNQKRMALNTSWEDTSETTARSLTGSFNPAKFTGNLKGFEDPNFKVKLKLSPLLYGSPSLPCDED